MKRTLLSTLGLAIVAIGCVDRTPPPPRTPVPAPGSGAPTRHADAPRPLELPPPDPSEGLPFRDEPLVSQRPPEQRAFVEAYNQVGRPRLTLFVNRTLEGATIPAEISEPDALIQRRQRATGEVDVDRRIEASAEDRQGRVDIEGQSRFRTTGPAEYTETTEVFLRPGQYNPAFARDIDYQAMETILTDWLGANGQTILISPTLARQRLTDQQVRDIESGQPRALSEVARQLNVDVLVQVSARPTRQTHQGLAVRIVAEAMNIDGGQSIGRAVVDVPPPLDKTQLNRYTRYLARKLMDDMTATWSASIPRPAATTQP